MKQIYEILMKRALYTKYEWKKPEDKNTSFLQTFGNCHFYSIESE